MRISACKPALIAVAYAGLIGAALAQSIGGMSGIGPLIGGSSGGAAPTGCTNQLVLDYSNSCALIAQAWGQ